MRKYIILHHSATPDNKVLRDFDAIRRYHKEVRGWRDIGYHWVVEYVDGKLSIIPGRPEAEDGAHCIGHNQDSIGVCVVGNYEEETPSEALYGYVAQLCVGIMQRNPSIQKVVGHKDMATTLCPGKNFDIIRVRELINRYKYKNTCTIDIKGYKFPGYLHGGRSYFGDAVAVTDVIKAISPQVAWDEKTMTVLIK